MGVNNLHHFMEFAEEMQWDLDYLLQSRKNDPNVNLKFQEDLKEKFENTSNKTFQALEPAHCIKFIHLSNRAFQNFL